MKLGKKWRRTGCKPHLYFSVAAGAQGDHVTQFILSTIAPRYNPGHFRRKHGIVTKLARVGGNPLSRYSSMPMP
ncbi:MAG TPA: hypothetical protein VJA25_06755, partial [Dehalococcoidia bacterium]|nr:hypothetical protein [Dehalococcoidia bacterium]